LSVIISLNENAQTTEAAISYRIHEDETVEVALQRIARKQVDKAIDDIDNNDLDAHETVHEVRKRCKKIRGLIRLVRPAFAQYKQANDWFRDAAGELSQIRDATSLLECFDALMKRHGDELDAALFAPMRDALLERRDDQMSRLDCDERLDAFRQAMKKSRKRITTWSLDKEGFVAVSGGLGKTYGRARQAMQKAYAKPTVERFHEWRKRVKYNWYHTQLLQDTWKPILKPIRKQTKHLADLLGDDHDLGVFRDALLAEPDRFGPQQTHPALLALIDHRRKELQAWAHPLGQRLYADKPKIYVNRFERSWRAWRTEQQLKDALADEAAVVHS